MIEIIIYAFIVVFIIRGLRLFAITDQTINEIFDNFK
jgi:hypothetical protein